MTLFIEATFSFPRRCSPATENAGVFGIAFKGHNPCPFQLYCFVRKHVTFHPRVPPHRPTQSHSSRGYNTDFGTAMEEYEEDRRSRLFLRSRLTQAMAQASTASKRVMTLAPMSSPIEPPMSPVTQPKYLKCCVRYSSVVGAPKTI